MQAQGNSATSSYCGPLSHLFPSRAHDTVQQTVSVSRKRGFRERWGILPTFVCWGCGGLWRMWRLWRLWRGLGMSTPVLDGKTSDCFPPKFYVINV